MSLVHDNSAVVVQVWLPQGLSEQDTVRHVLYQGFLWCAVLKADCIAHLQGTVSINKYKKITNRFKIENVIVFTKSKRSII